MAIRIATYDDPLVRYDDNNCTYDGTVVISPIPVVPPAVSHNVGAHGLLTPQNIIHPHREWTKEESERWINRLRKSPEELRDEAEREEAEAIALIISLLV